MIRRWRTILATLDVPFAIKQRHVAQQSSIPALAGTGRVIQPA
jgi:hypothetical protein